MYIYGKCIHDGEERGPFSKRVVPDSNLSWEKEIKLIIFHHRHEKDDQS